MKTCTKCHIEKPLDDFYKSKGKALSWCISCHNQWGREYNKKKWDSDPIWREKRKASTREWEFGIPLVDYDLRWQNQEFCLICGDKLLGGKQTHLDHNHKTGKIRAFLCEFCNKGLGNFRDNINLLREAIWYLEHI